MPKHMTGDEFIVLMERKKQEKEDIEEGKKKRKLEIIEKKIEQKKRKQEKERAMQEKKILVAEKKAENERLRQNKKLIAEEKKAKREAIRRGKAKKKTPVFRPPFLLITSHPSSTTHPSQETECCTKCGRHEHHDCDEEWVSCDNCSRWWHILCTDTPAMSAVELSIVNWNCTDCRL